MDKSREEQIVAALGGHWGFSYGRYTYMGMAIPEPDLCGKATDRVNEAVRQRVRELCTNPEVAGGHGIKLEYYGNYSECELYECNTCKDVLRWDGDMKEEQKEFWEEALLILAEKKG